MILAGTFPVLTVSVGVGVLIVLIAAIARYRLVSRRRPAPLDALVPDEVRPRARQTASAKPPVGTLPSATPPPETQPGPAGLEPASPPSISAFRQVIPQATGGTPPQKASYVWE